MQFIALDDGRLPGAGLGDGGHCLGPWYAASAKIRSMNGKKPDAAWIEDEQYAVAVLHSGRVDDDVQQQAVSTRIWRLRPLTLLAASKPCGSSVDPFEPLGALTVDDRGGWARFPALTLARGDIERMVDALQRVVPATAC